MKEKKTKPVVPANGQLRKDEDICLILRGKVTETAPLDNGLTEIDIDVYTVNGTTPISSPISYKAWFPLKVATPPNKGDEVTIRVAVVKPTSTADDFITATIDYVGQIDGGPFDDFSFFAEVKSSTSRDGSFWILLPTNSVDNDEEEKVVYLRFELIQPESDEPDDKEIIEATIETLNEIPDSDYGQAEIRITSIAGTPVEDEYCHLILGPDAYDYSDDGDEITIELRDLKPCAEEDGSAEGKVYDIRPIAGTDFCVIAFVVNRIDGDEIQPTAHCIIDSKDHNFKLGDTAFLSPTSIDDDEEPDEPKRGSWDWVASGIASFFRWLIG